MISTRPRQTSSGQWCRTQTLCCRSNNRLDAPRHVRRRSPRKRQQKNTLRAHARNHQMRHPVSQRHRLAGSRAGDNEQRPRCERLGRGIEQPWTTVRETLSEISFPVSNPPHSRLTQHDRIPGARPYPGHTGSPPDAPAKSLKAGVHGVAGGENMLGNINGSVRYFTVRESARIQTFPDEWRFQGSWANITRQIGNAVPVELARVVGDTLFRALTEWNRLAAGTTCRLILK